MMEGGEGRDVDVEIQKMKEKLGMTWPDSEENGMGVRAEMQMMKRRFG